jgi:hypothetical protein
MSRDHDRRIHERDAGKLTLDHFRHLTRWCDDQWGMWWHGLTIVQILACYHAANDAGYAGLDEWAADNRQAAGDAWRAIKGGP